MEGELRKPIIKELSVILIREPLVENKEQEHLQCKNDDQCSLEYLKLNMKKQVLSVNIFKSHNLPYEQQSKLNQKQDGKYNCSEDNHSVPQVTIEEENILSTTNIKGMTPLRTTDVESNVVKDWIFNKIPVYQQKVKDGPNSNDDLYEFDEPDFENTTTIGSNLNKKRKVKHLTQMNKKKRKLNKVKVKKCKNTYDALVQNILQKVMKKVNHGKLENKNSSPIRKEPPYEHNENVIPLQDNLLNVSDTDSNCDHHEVEMNENPIVDENETLSEHGAPDNTQVLCCFYSPIKANKEIHIISDIMLDKFDDSFLNQQPNANSTVLINKRCNPWRFNEHLIRNPHYLYIKKTALPCLQQDLILDYIQVKKIEEHFAKTKKLESRKNKSMILEESENSCDTSNKENTQHSNLFDSGNFIVDQPKALQDNLQLNKPKQNILAPRLQNEDNIIKTVKNIPKINTNAVDICTFFNRQLSKSLDAEKLDENLSMSSEDSVKESVNNNFDLKLFEYEEEPSLNFSEITKIYIPKTRKKKKFYNVEEPNHDKHKKVMTRTEEAELEQWAAKFNSLCKDIEKYKLEIE